jgi:hypothetical protein
MGGKNRSSCAVGAFLTMFVMFIVLALIAFNPMSQLFWGSKQVD